MANIKSTKLWGASDCPVTGLKGTIIAWQEDTEAVTAWEEDAQGAKVGYTHYDTHARLRVTVQVSKAEATPTAPGTVVGDYLVISAARIQDNKNYAKIEYTLEKYQKPSLI